MSSRSRLSRVAPSTRRCPGGCISGVRPRTCLAARGIVDGSADRRPVARRGRRPRLGPVAERGAFLPLASPLPGGRRSGGRSVRTVGRVAPRPSWSSRSVVVTIPTTRPSSTTSRQPTVRPRIKLAAWRSVVAGLALTGSAAIRSRTERSRVDAAPRVPPRSRSETMPTRRPRSTTTRWRMRWRRIVARATLAGSSAPTVITSTLITSRSRMTTPRASGAPGSSRTD
jgi:hypothetical protein